MTWLAAALTAATLDGGTHKRVGVKLHIISCLFKSYIPLSYVNRATIRNVCMHVFSRENLVSTSLCVCVCYRSVSRMITEVRFSRSSPRLLKKNTEAIVESFLDTVWHKKKSQIPRGLLHSCTCTSTPASPLFSLLSFMQTMHVTPHHLHITFNLYHPIVPTILCG